MKNMVKGFPSIDKPNQLCEGCLVRKKQRHSFPNESISRVKAPLELIHTDVCGLINLAPFGKNIYFLQFIKDYSRKTWVYFLKQKSKVFLTFKRFKALVRKQSGYQIKAMRFDRGGEFTSKQFKAFCEENGIHRPLIILYSPQRNGVVEGKNRSRVNKTRSMLKSKNLPKEFWAEALDCAVYQRKNLDDKSEKYIFIRYSQQSNRYKLYNPVDKMMKLSRDVTFDEKSSWEWIDRDKEYYVFYPMDTGKKEVEEEPIDPKTPSSPESPTQSSPASSLTNSLVKAGPQCKRSLDEIYDDLNQNQNMFCLFANAGPIYFDEASRSKNGGRL
ncbi:hypothetical protein RJ639_010269 [Escallonia herrerae]|uniref:Integrase catalytic domain-containing protein n=1 Tax=Escallonia herrerae TaxID=1293975 RepID=A0AA89AT60_9ASTE|nr:hypothetical protein RJ639_010269 [Escallonia herrerae]